MTGEPDIFARVVAGVALLLTLVQMYAGTRTRLWIRRSSNVEDVQRTLEELKVGLDAAAADALGAASLWTQSVDVLVQSLGEQVAVVPDRRLARLARRIHDDVVALRGTATPSNEDLLNNGVTLNAEQRKLLERATVHCDGALGRVRASIRKGGRQR